jgi:hypothetical protein
MIRIMSFDCVTIDWVQRFPGNNPVWVSKRELDGDSDPETSAKRLRILRFVEYDVGKPQVDPVIDDCIYARTLHPAAPENLQGLL